MEGQGGCERRSEAFVKFRKKKIFFFFFFGGGGRGWGRGCRVGGQGGCERRSEAFVKIQKKWGGRGRGVRSGVGVWKGR